MNTLERKAWLESRRCGLGATDVASLVGVGFSDPLEVWRDKTQPVEEREVHPLLMIGLATENINASLYSKRMDVQVVKPPHNITRHPKVDYAIASLDFQRADGRPVETKFTPFFNDQWGTELSCEVPEGYIVQTQWQMDCAEQNSADISALSGTGDHRVYTVEGDPAFVRLLHEIAGEFWHQFVLKGDAPPSDWRHPAAGEINAKCHAIIEGKTLQLDERAEQLAREYREFKSIIKESEVLADARKAQLLAIMGDAEKATAGNYRLSRIQIEGGKEIKYTSQPYVRFDVREPKKGK